MAENTLATTETLPQETRREAPATREPERYLIPPVDIYETDQGLTVLVDMPGVEKDGINVRVEDGLLTIEGRVPREHDERPGVWSEFELLDYYRQFQLGEQIDPNNIDAELKHGVLTINLPKAEAARPRQIEVKVA